MAKMVNKKRELKKVERASVIKAFDYIDKNGVPQYNQAVKYVVVYQNKEYPVKYLLAVASHLQYGADIETEYFTSDEARDILIKLAFPVNSKQDFKLVITKDDIVSSDPTFTMDNLALGDNYQPILTYLEYGKGRVVYRDRAKGEKRKSNQIMPRLIFQCFEDEIGALTETERKEFPTCRYSLDGYVFKGIYSSVEEMKASTQKNSIEFMYYTKKDGSLYVIYVWNIFSTIIFVQECLKRFGNEGDKVVLFYKPKDKKDEKTGQDETIEEREESSENKTDDKDKNGVDKPKFPLNQILYGPPGTGKTYNSVIYAVAICKGEDVEKLKKECKDKEKYEKILKEYKDLQEQGRIEFITFHQSYGYEEFIQGIKPSVDKGQVVYNVEDGIFKAFCEDELTDEMWNDFTQKVKEFVYTDGGGSHKVVWDEKNQKYYVKGIQNAEYLGAGKDEVKEIQEGTYNGKGGSAPYTEKVANEILRTLRLPKKGEPKVFIIDEINRGNVSKIFGELITLIEEGKRISAEDPNQGMTVKLPYKDENGEDVVFGVPDNVYILGTMNTADRSLVQLDAALRRRFRFIEMMPKPEKLDKVGDIDLQKLLKAINERISVLVDREHQIGHSYFMKVETLEDLKETFEYEIIPLLQEYFYEDYKDINTVLNENGFIEKKDKWDYAKDTPETYVLNADNIKGATAYNFIKIYDDKAKVDEQDNQAGNNETSEDTLVENAN